MYQSPADAQYMAACSSKQSLYTGQAECQCEPRKHISGFKCGFFSLLILFLEEQNQISQQAKLPCASTPYPFFLLSLHHFFFITFRYDPFLLYYNIIHITIYDLVTYQKQYETSSHVFSIYIQREFDKSYGNHFLTIFDLHL